MRQDAAKGILEGIVSGACRIYSINKRQYRIKAGGKMTSGSQCIDLYVSMQNANADVNCKRARDTGLIRRCFRIQQPTIQAVPQIDIIEWSAALDWGKPYRNVWSAPAEQMAARTYMMHAFAFSHLQIGQ